MTKANNKATKSDSFIIEMDQLIKQQSNENEANQSEGRQKFKSIIGAICAFIICTALFIGFYVRSSTKPNDSNQSNDNEQDQLRQILSDTDVFKFQWTDKDGDRKPRQSPIRVTVRDILKSLGDCQSLYFVTVNDIPQHLDFNVGHPADSTCVRAVWKGQYFDEVVNLNDREFINIQFREVDGLIEYFGKNAHDMMKSSSDTTKFTQIPAEKGVIRMSDFRDYIEEEGYIINPRQNTVGVVDYVIGAITLNQDPGRSVLQALYQT